MPMFSGYNGSNESGAQSTLTSCLNMAMFSGSNGSNKSGTNNVCMVSENICTIRTIWTGWTLSVQIDKFAFNDTTKHIVFAPFEPFEQSEQSLFRNLHIYKKYMYNLHHSNCLNGLNLEGSDWYNSYKLRYTTYFHLSNNLNRLNIACSEITHVLYKRSHSIY